MINYYKGGVNFMNYLIYNPLSRNNRTAKDQTKFIKKIKSCLPNDQEFLLQSVLDIKDVNSFIAKIVETDKVIIIGGDGTLNHIANSYNFDNYPYNNIYLFKYGTGNDFRRSFQSKEPLINITTSLQHLPQITLNGKAIKFLNGAGLGLDGLISKYANVRKSKQAYYKAALKAFRDIKPYDLKVTSDNNTYEFQKVWMALFMNAPYIGGGMKVAPNINRFDPYLDLVIISNISKLKILFLFPLIYCGKHLKLKKYVKVIRGKHFEVLADGCKFVQTDGETLENKTGFTITAGLKD